MSRKLLFFGVMIFLLTALAVTPFSVLAEGDPPPEPIQAPWITGVNPSVEKSSTSVEDLDPSGLITSWDGVEVPLLAAPPSYVELEPQQAEDSRQLVDSLAVPQRYQDPTDATCGAAALGMALDFLALNGEGSAPSQAALVYDLKEAGLLYETGTGVEELAYLARNHGYQGTSAFHDWTLAQLQEQLGAGNPVVVSLGANGRDQTGHFVTVTGISADGKWVSYNDPILGKQTLTATEFIKTWELGGNAGLLVQKEPLSALNDPMLPWMGLFSAMAALAVIAKQMPLSAELDGLVAMIKGALADPRRKGLGGRLIAGGGGSSSPPYTAPPGYSWKKKTVTKYGWKDIQVTEKVKVPNIVRTYGVVRYNRWVEKIPVYKTVTVDRGRWAYRSVKKYRTERYRTKERYRVKRTYWYRRGWRLYKGTRYEWKTRTVVKTRRVPYYVRERYWVPKIVREQRLVRYREVEHKEPVYGWKEEIRGTRTIERTKTTRAWAPIGTETKWELKKLPDPPKPKANSVWEFKEEFLTGSGKGLNSMVVPAGDDPFFTPTPPYPTPTHTPDPGTPTPTPTPTPLYPTQGSFPTATLEPSPTATLEPTPSATPDWTPRPTYGPFISDPEATQIAEVTTGVNFVRKVGIPILDMAKTVFGGGGGAVNLQPTSSNPFGITSGIINAAIAIGARSGVDSSVLDKWKLGAKTSDVLYSGVIANTAFRTAQLPTGVQSISNAFGAASSQTGIGNRISTAAGSLGDDLGNQLAIMGEKVINASPAIKILQGLGAVGGLVGGGFQIKSGVSMGENSDPYDDALGTVQTVGGIATVAGSGITLAGVAASAAGAALPAALLGAAPVLLGVGAIAAGGVLAYNLFKDTKMVKKANEGLETWANKPDGFVETAIASGQSMVESGIPTGLAVPLAVADSVFQQSVNGVKNTVNNMVEDVKYAAETVGNAAKEYFEPINNIMSDVSNTAASAFNTITQPITNAAEFISNSVQNSAQSFSNAVKNTADGVKDFFGGLFGP